MSSRQKENVTSKLTKPQPSLRSLQFSVPGLTKLPTGQFSQPPGLCSSHQTCTDLESPLVLFNAARCLLSTHPVFWARHYVPGPSFFPLLLGSSKATLILSKTSFILFITCTLPVYLMPRLSFYMVHVKSVDLCYRRPYLCLPSN